MRVLSIDDRSTPVTATIPATSRRVRVTARPSLKGRDGLTVSVLPVCPGRAGAVLRWVRVGTPECSPVAGRSAWRRQPADPAADHLALVGVPGRAGGSNPGPAMRCREVRTVDHLGSL